MAWSTLKEPSERNRKAVNGRAHSAATPPPPCTLLFLDPARNISEGTEQRLVASHISLGRGKDCLVCYGEEFPMVSRMHAAIEWSNNNYYIRHLSETNQTLLNGRPISRKWFLQDGDVIQLAPSGPKIQFNATVLPFETEPDKEEKKEVDFYFIALVAVISLSVGLIAWLAYQMMLDA